ncbi:13284_t:CDS:2 [Gigaspora margarita]|uniref:13284_t:CDS:1 n=1 Tax=Gigaspora margarita TaxID=4874 RepID=A0ABN7UQ84_GIGMA|nr:13284_t:CDS:2 [Gigaspora margarita]
MALMLLKNRYKRCWVNIYKDLDAKEPEYQYTMLSYSDIYLFKGFMQNTVKHSNYLTYQENPSNQANLTEAQPHILTISRYSDNSGTAVVRITRVNYYNYFTMNYCYEQRLLLRVIQSNRSVSEINYANATEIQDINYCNIGIDWYPNEFIVNNITPENGFLRLSTVNGNETGSFKWSQYGYNGTFSLVHNGTIPGLLDPTSFQATAIATLDGGYALIYTNTTNRTFTSDNMLTAQFSANAGIYAVMLGYNPPKISQSFILYQLTTPNITFTGLYCYVDFVFIGHSCIAYAKRTQTTTVTSNITNSGTFYVRIRFLSSGTIQSIDPMFPPNSGNLTNVRPLPFGGYAVITRVNNNRRNYNFTLDLYDEDGKLSEYDSTLKQITANFDGAFAVLRNNTILVALNETISSWQILLVDLPPLSQYNKSDYGNLFVRKAYPPTNFTDLPLNTNMINITFNVLVSLSGANDSILVIYQKINDKFIIRQIMKSNNCKNCIASGELGDIRGILRLTISESQHFQELNDSGKHDFFVTLIEQLTYMVPTEKGRLKSDKHYQLNSSNILISLFIYEAKDNEKLTAANIKDYLHQLIINKEFTVISMGNVTKFLDETYGFQQSLAMFTILIATDYEYLTILKDVSIFTKKLYRYEPINALNIFSIIDHIFEDVIIWGAFIDIFFRNIPQIIILAVSKFIILPLRNYSVMNNVNLQLLPVFHNNK